MMQVVDLNLLIQAADYQRNLCFDLTTGDDFSSFHCVPLWRFYDDGFCSVSGTHFNYGQVNLLCMQPAIQLVDSAFHTLCGIW